MELLAAHLGVLAANFKDFAWAGATTGVGNHLDSGSPTPFGASSLPGMATEFGSTPAGLSPYIGGLFVVWGGPNDFLSPSPIDQTPQAVIGRAVSDIVTLVGGLEALGARNILVPGMPDLGLTPYSRSNRQGAQGTALTDGFNAALSGALQQANLPGVRFFDSASLVRSVVANPAAYGLTNVTDPCFNGTSVCANPNQYLFWDAPQISVKPTLTA